MKQNRYPRILIIGETFGSDSGGGITLTNLFKGYPKECLANAIDSSDIDRIISNNICSNFFALGKNEKKTTIPIPFLQKKYRSGVFYPDAKKTGIGNEKSKKTLRKKVVERIANFLKFIGLYHILFKYTISREFKNWIDEFAPDIIYSQLSTRELINFVSDLIDYTGATLAIHIMDDWPKTISSKGLLKNYWKKKIDYEFWDLLDRADILLSISEGMSEEYLERYNRKFIPFHNPIEIEKWLPYSKKDVEPKVKPLTILYAGRIGLGINDSLIEIGQAIDELRDDGLDIEFRIQTTTIGSNIRERLSKCLCIRFNPKVDYSELPKIFSNADLLVMPIDFSENSINFLKLSMPTKASEYMISGTPILLYASSKVSLVRHAKKYGWAKVVSEQNINLLKSEILNLLTNNKLRTQLSEIAKQHAIMNYSSDEVRNNFQNQFIKITKQHSHV